MSEIKVEQWKDIRGYEETYQISSFGRVKSKTRITNVGIKNVKKCLRPEKILKNQKLTKGYYGVRLYKDKIAKTFKIHRLVAEHFIDNPNNYKQVNHIDGNKANNKIENLEWCTCEQNMKHSYNIGLRDLTKIRENMRILGKSKKGLEVRWGKKYA